MRLLYLGDTSSPHFRAWPRHFAALGHDVHVCHLVPGPPGPPIGGATTHPAPRLLRSPLRGAWLGSALGTRRLWRSLRPDVAHSHQFIPCGYLAELGGLGPHVATAWGSEVLLATGMGKRLVRRVARGADLITADSHHLLAVIEAAGAAPSKLRWVPWGVSPEWRALGTGVSKEQAAAATGLTEAVPFALFQRGVRRLYRPDVFLDALAEVRRTGHDLNGVVVELGADAADADRGLRDRAAADPDLRGAITFIPRREHDEMAELYAAAAMCVSIPESDSAPTSVFEALAVGTPAIVSDLPWVSEPVHRDAALEVVPVGDAAALTAAMARVLEAGESGAGPVIRANSDLIDRHFDRVRVFGEMEREYQRLAAAGGPS